MLEEKQASDPLGAGITSSESLLEGLWTKLGFLTNTTTVLEPPILLFSPVNLFFKSMNHLSFRLRIWLFFDQIFYGLCYIKKWQLPHYIPPCYRILSKYFTPAFLYTYICTKIEFVSDVFSFYTQPCYPGVLGILHPHTILSKETVLTGQRSRHSQLYQMSPWCSCFSFFPSLSFLEPSSLLPVSVLSKPLDLHLFSNTC